MNGTVFRPRRRPILRLALALGLSASLTFAGGMVVWIRVNVVPPDCSDPATLTLVRQSLLSHFKVPANSFDREYIKSLKSSRVNSRG